MMATLPLLPGEHEELRLRPAPAGFLGAYGRALVPAVLGLFFWLLAAWQPVWQNANSSAPDWQFWNHLWGDDQALAFYVVAAIVVAALVDFALRRRARAFLVATTALVVLMIGAAAFRSIRMPTATALPILVASLAVPAAAWVELRRRRTTYIFTNLRLIRRQSVLQMRESAVRHQDLVDLQGGRVLGDVGTIVPVVGKAAVEAGGHAPLRFGGIRPYVRVRAFVELLVQRATAGDYLRADQRLDQRIAEARASLQRT